MPAVVMQHPSRQRRISWIAWVGLGSLLLLTAGFLHAYLVTPAPSERRGSALSKAVQWPMSWVDLSRRHFVAKPSPDSPVPEEPLPPSRRGSSPAGESQPPVEPPPATPLFPPEATVPKPVA